MVEESKCREFFRENLKEENDSYFDLIVKGETVYQYCMGSHHVAGLENSEFDEIKSLFEEKGLEKILSNRDEGFIDYCTEGELDKDFSIMKDVLAIRGLDVESVDSVEYNM